MNNINVKINRVFDNEYAYGSVEIGTSKFLIDIREYNNGTTTVWLSSSVPGKRIDSIASLCGVDTSVIEEQAIKAYKEYKK